MRMRYKKKHALYLFGFGWCVWYLGLLRTDKNVDVAKSVRHAIDGSPDIFRYKLLQASQEEKQVVFNSSFVTRAPYVVPESVNSTFASPTWFAEYLPHIRNESYVQPRIHWTQGRKNASVIIGIPTIKRPTDDIYIYETLQSFFEAMTDQERSDIIIVVSIMEPWNLDFEAQLLKTIKKRFSKQLQEGALEVISPHPEFYPDLDRLKLSLGDPKPRVKWRSKQNLDYGFLMMHCIGKAEYYLQMEDDISTVKGFVTSIKKTVAKEKNKRWMALCFSQLGYIGRLYNIWEVKGIMEYLLKNFDKKPCDWLQYDYLRQQLCEPKQPRKECDKVISRYTWLIKPTLFQHKGFRSSFQGNINKLQDKYFSQGKRTGLYANPKAKGMITSLDVHGGHKLHSAYYTKGFFWGKNPRKGDTIEFLYSPPISVSRIAMISGQPKRPKDIITNASLEILPVNAPDLSSNSSLFSLESVPLRPRIEIPQANLLERQRNAALPYLNNTNEKLSFYVVGHFKNGQVDGEVGPDVGKIGIIRVRFGVALEHWVILDQILVV